MNREAALQQKVPLAMLAAVALLVVPQSGSAFAGPKTLAWAAFAAALAVLAARRQQPLTLTAPIAFALANALGWLLAALAGDAAQPQAVLLQGVAAATWLVLAFHPPRLEDVARTATVVGALVAALALLQWGLGTRTRLAAFSTLGNPDFVAAFVTPCLVLAAQRKRWLPAALMLGALCVTRSWATVLALGAAAAVARRPALLAAAVLAALAAAVRDVGPIVQGRFELWEPALGHLSLWGHGPGAALALTGTDHLHNDWLEVLLDRGPLGLAALLATFAWKRKSPALAAFAARMCVDFPLARPAELCLFVVLVTAKEET